MKKSKKTNIKDYFTNYDKISSRIKVAQSIIDSHNGDLTKCSLSDYIMISGDGAFTPQKRTKFLEDKMIEDFSWTPVSSSVGRGDYIDSNGKYFELKCSSSNDSNTINILQIRPWQDIDYYLVIYFDLDDYRKSKAYILSKNDMINEINKLSSSCHGTKIANMRNENVEKSIHLPIDNEWDGKYLNNSFFNWES